MHKLSYGIVLLVGALSWPAMAGNPATDTSSNELTQNQKLPEHYRVVLDIKDLPAVPLSGSLFGEDIHQLLQQHLSLFTKQNAPNLNADQIEFMLHETPTEVEQILNTQGFFNNHIQTEKIGDTYHVHINVGKQVHIANVIVVLSGAVTADENLPYYYRDLFLNWRLPMGAAFTQNDWAASKAEALSVVTQKMYPLAKITESRVEINPKTSSAVVSLFIDSYNPVYFGTIAVTGNKRYPASLVRNLADFSAGSSYDLNKLLDYQQSLEQDGHYSGVMVHANFDNIRENVVPLDVAVTEVPRQKLDLGLKYNTSDGTGIRVGYDHYNIFKRGYTGSAVLDANRYEQMLGLGISQPRDAKGHFYTTNLAFGNKTVQKVKSQTLGAGFWKARVRNGIDARIGIEYFLEQSQIKDGPDLGKSYVTMLTASWKSNRIETRDRPANGYYASIKLGSTVGTVLSSANVQRITADAAYYYTPSSHQWGTWIARGTLGYVHAGNTDDVPTALLFRSGGANSVRGYETDSIGLPGPNQSVLGGKAMALASLEYQYPVSRDWSLAIFHDAGDVKNRFQDLKLKHASGAGVRWFSPVAPLSFDIAYAHERHKFAWYLSLGTRF